MFAPKNKVIHNAKKCHLCRSDLTNVCYRFQANFKQHRHHEPTLKSNEPLIVSMGWHRFQTVMTYSAQDKSNKRYKMLECTKQGEFCQATFTG